MIPFWADTVKEFLDLRQNRRTPDGLVDDVVVALIDDGVDKMNTRHAEQIILPGKSLDFHDGKMRPAFSSSKGHGTVMANMILRVCPMVKIYPIRLKTYQTTGGKSPSIDAAYAAQVCANSQILSLRNFSRNLLWPPFLTCDFGNRQAIQTALDKKAAIISMSWTIPMPQNVSAVDTPCKFSFDPARPVMDSSSRNPMMEVSHAYPCSA
jgi:hypothetical protein